jgi:hypothetical protein
MDSWGQQFWIPTPDGRRTLLIGGLVGLVAARVILCKRKLGSQREYKMGAVHSMRRTTALDCAAGSVKTLSALRSNGEDTVPSIVHHLRAFGIYPGKLYP